MESNKILNNKFEPKNVNEVIDNFLILDNKLGTELSKNSLYVDEVSRATSELIEFELEKILESIKIEEVNKGDLSVRTSLLKKAGYSNFLKVYKSSYNSRLFNIRGVSVESARIIKRGVDETAKQIRVNLVPRLNVDNKNKYSNALIKAIYAYIASEPFIKNGVNLYTKYHIPIIENTSKAKRLTNNFKWFFTSKKNKISSINAFLELKEFEEEKYLDNAKFILDSILKINNASTQVAWNDFENNSAKYFAVLEKLQGFKTENSSLSQGLPFELAESINNINLNLEGLKCILRSYQEFGVKYILNQKRVLLGDEMGLGKTVQAIASMVSVRNQGETHFLVVCPASVLINWCREIALHSDLKAIKLHGEERDKNFDYWLNFGGVAVTTYESMAKINFVAISKISMLVADEAHYVKNPKARRTINLMKLTKLSSRVLFMTGTPLENKVEEMCFLMKCLQPELTNKIDDLMLLSSAPMFREIVAPVYFRRTRESVLKELPDLIETEEWCEMQNEEKQQYVNSTLARDFMDMRQVSWQVDVNLSSKAQRLLEIYERAKEEKRKIIVFSYFLNTVEQVKKLLGDKCFGPIDGSVPPSKRQQIIDEFSKSEDGSVLVAQIQAGGTGLNIQAASFVVICEPQLKPSTENQAISRTYRMGQVRNVMVFRLLCENSVDERIMEILDTKQTIFDRFADKSVMGEHSIQITEQMTNKIIDSEIERLTKEKEE